MAKLYGEIAAKALLTLDKSFARANGQPLDASEVYYSKAAAKEYAATAQAYIGQKIVVIENGVVTHYSVEDTAGTLKELGAKPVADGTTVAIGADGKITLANIAEANKSGTYNAVLVNGKLTWVKPSETTVEGLDALIKALTGRVDDIEDAVESINTELEDIWSEIGEPANEEEGSDAQGLYAIIANEEARAKAAEEALGKRIDAIDFVDEDELTEALSDYVTSESFGTFKTENTQAIADAKSGAETTAANALAAARTEISKEIDDDVKVAKDRADEAYSLAEGKVDADEYAADKLVADNDRKAIREMAEATKDRVDTFLDTEGVADVVDSLKDIKAELDKMADATEVVEALAAKADKTVVEGIDTRVKAIEDAPYVKKSELDDVDAKFASYTNTEALEGLLAGKQDVIPAETYDAYGAAATAKSEAIADAEGKIATAKQEAIEAAAEYVNGSFADGINESINDLDERVGVLEEIDHTLFATKVELEAHEEAAAAAYATKDYVGIIPTGYEEKNVIAYVNKKAEEVLSQATGGSSESAASVKAQLDTYKSQNAPKFEKLEGIEAGAQVNVIEEVVAAEGAKISVSTTDKKVTVNDKALIDLIAAAQKAGDDAAQAANGAQGTANKAKQAAEDNAGAIGTINGTLKSHGDSIVDYSTRITNLEQADIAHAAEYSTLAGLVSGHTDAIAKKADATALDAVSSRVSTNESDIKTLKETTIPAINESIGKKANSADVYTKTEVNAITGTVAEGKTLVDMINAAKTEATYDDTAIKGLITGEETRAKKAEADLTAEIEKTNAAVAAILENNDEEGLNSIKELAAWINEHGAAAEDMVKAIEANADAIDEINNETTGILALAKDYTDTQIGNLPAATKEEFGLVMIDDKTIKVDEGEHIYVAEVSTDLLVQGTEEFILNGGTAAN